MIENIIQQLKDNEKPFGLMSEEMQEKAWGIRKNGFERFFARGNGTWGEMDMTNRVFLHDTTYRLRPDYEEEPEIVEYKIIIGGCTAWMDMLAYIDGRCVEAGICEASAYPDFIGFKFDGYSDLFNEAIMYEWNGKLYREVQLDWVLSGKATILHATHVLFRRNKLCA